MKKNNIPNYLILLTVTSFVLFLSCSMPATTIGGKTSTSLKGSIPQATQPPAEFRIQSLPEPEKVTPPVEVLAYNGKIDLDIRHERKYPRNMPVKFKDSSLVHAEFKPYKDNPDNPKIKRESRRFLIKQQQDWFQGRFNFALAQLRQQQQFERNQAIYSFQRNTDGLSNKSQDYKDLKSAYDQQRLDMRTRHKTEITSLRAAYKESRQAVPAYIDEVLSQGAFRTASTTNCNYSDSLAGELCQTASHIDTFIKSIQHYFGGNSSAVQQVKQDLKNNPPPPAQVLPIRDYTYYALNDPTARRTFMDSHMVQHSDPNQIQKLDSLNFYSRMLTEVKNQQSPYSSHRIRLRDLLQSIHIDGVDTNLLSQYTCGTNASTTDENCDEVVSFLANSLLPTLPSYLKNANISDASVVALATSLTKQPTRKGDGTLVLTSNSSFLAKSGTETPSCSGHSQAYCIMETLLKTYYVPLATQNKAPAIWQQEWSRIQTSLEALFPANREEEIVVRIESPTHCSQGYMQGWGVAAGGLQLVEDTSTVLMDGDFKLDLGLQSRYSNFEIGRTLLQTPIKINLAQILGLSLNDYRNRIRNNTAEEAKYPLRIGPLKELENQGQFGFHITNRTANLFDIQMLSMGQSIPNFHARCVDGNRVNWLFNHDTLETGVYHVYTYYSTDSSFHAYNEQAASSIPVNPTATPFPVPNPSGAPSGSIQPPFIDTQKVAPAKLVVLHPDYSTFAYMSDKPAASILSTKMRSESNDNTVTIEGIQGQSYYYSPNLSDGTELDSPHPPLQPAPSAFTVPERNPGADTVARTLVGLLSTPGTSWEQHFSDADKFPDFSAGNLLTHIVAGGQDNTATYQAFKQVTTHKNAGYLQIGTVVNLASCFNTSNFALGQTEQIDSFNVTSKEIPMLLKLIRKDNQQVLRTWPFEAKLGTHTFFQTYWSGTSQENRPDDGELHDQQIPVYAPGTYVLRTEINHEVMPQQLEWLNKVFKGNVTYPRISEASTDVEIVIAEATSDDDLISQENFDEIRENVNAALEIITPYAMMDFNDGTTRLAFMDEGYDDNFGIAMERKYQIPKADWQKIQFQFETTKNSLTTVNNNIDVLLEEGLQNQSLRAKNARAALRQYLRKSSVSSTDLIKYAFAKTVNWQNLVRATSMVGWAEILSVPPGSLNFELQRELKLIHNTLKSIEDTVLVKVAAQDNRDRCISVREKDSRYTTAKSLVFLNLSYQRGKLSNLMEELSSLPFTTGASQYQSLLSRARSISSFIPQHMTTVFDVVNALIEVCSECVNNERKTKRVNNILTSSNPFITSVLGGGSHSIQALQTNLLFEPELKCRILKMNDTERNWFLDTLKIRTALVTKVVPEDIAPSIKFKGNKYSLNVGLSANEIARKTIGFFLYPNNNEPIIGFSGENALKKIPNIPSNVNSQDSAYIRQQLEDKWSQHENEIFNFFNQTITAKILTLNSSSISHVKIAKSPSSSSLFKSTKQVQNDTEIKMLDTFSQRHVLGHNSQSVMIYTDRITCEFCQEVIHRVNYPNILNSLKFNHTNSVKHSNTYHALLSS